MLERSAVGMSWAVDARTGQPVYVGKLGAAHVGLRCGCVCPACDAPLQAVFVGHEGRGRRPPFFRHHRLQQGPGCKFRVAELAALRLLAESDLIEIPAPRRSGVYPGASGQIYTGEAVGAAAVQRVVSRRFIGVAQAILTLEGGREVVLQLRGQQDITNAGVSLAVIEVQVDDPEVALMSPDDILAQARLNGHWMRLLRHCDDDEVQRLADAQARSLALEQLDIHPGELDLPEGATPKQASESLLHWAIKDAILQLSMLQAPGFSHRASAVDGAGKTHMVTVSIPPMALTVSAAESEVLFDGYRPDIVCKAVAPDGAMGQFDLLVEVAVTSKVSKAKLELIRRDGLACIELDVASFSSGGRVSRSQLRDLVAKDLSCKAWLHHRHMAQLVASAESQVALACMAADAEAAAAQRRAVEAERVELLRQEGIERASRAREAWAKELPPERALQELRVLLEQEWSEQPLVTSNGMRWERSQFLRAIRGVVPVSMVSPGLLVNGGVAWQLSRILEATRPDGRALAYDDTVHMPHGISLWGRESWLGLFHLVIEALGPRLAPEASRHADAEHRQVLSSLRSGLKEYVRSTEHDPLLVGLFPELAEVLAGEIGTYAYCQRLAAEREVARLAKDEEERVAAAAHAAEAERRQVPDAVDLACYQTVWRPDLNRPPSIDAAIGYLKFQGYRTPTHQQMEEVRMAFAARKAGASLADWIRSHSFGSVEDVGELIRLLEAAWLVVSVLRR